MIKHNLEQFINNDYILNRFDDTLTITSWDSRNKWYIKHDFNLSHYHQNASLYLFDSYVELDQYSNYLAPTFVTPTWKAKNNKVCLVNSEVPGMLLSRLDTSIKRSINTEKSDYIVCDQRNLPTSYRKEFRGIIAFKNGQTTNIYKLNWDVTNDYTEQHLQTVQALMPGYTVKWYLCIPASWDNQIEVLSKTTKPVISSFDVIKQLTSEQPKLNKEEFDSIKAMLSSNDSDNRELAINTILYYNWFDYIPEVLSIYCNNFIRDRNISTSMKYFYYLANLGGGNLKDIGESYSNEARLFVYNGFKFVKHPFMPEEVKVKLQNFVKQALTNKVNEEWGDALEKLEVRFVLEDDPRRETESSN